MGNNVFANGREVSCKAGDGKSICCFPDVCMTPPENPATPPGVPVPYPNTGFAKDTTKGSKSVKVSNKEVMLKNKSHFKTSTGNEAGCAAKKGVVTSKIKGKVYFAAWSMDVKIEGKNAVRHLDMTTHNHGSTTNTITTVHLDSQAFGNVPECDEQVDRAKKACKKAKVQTTRTKTVKGGKTSYSYSHVVKNCSKDCKKYQACLLVPKKDDKKKCCAPNNTGHHMIEDHWVTGKDSTFPMAQESSGYNAAPTVCANDSRFEGPHGVMHDVQGTFEESYMEGGAREGQSFNYGAGKEATLWAHQEAYPDSECSDECLEAQLDSFYGKDERRLLNEPDTQSLGGDRDELDYVWSDVLDSP